MNDETHTDYFITHRVAGQTVPSEMQANDRMQSHFNHLLREQADVVENRVSAAGRTAIRFRADEKTVARAQAALQTAGNGSRSDVIIEPIISLDHNHPHSGYLHEMAKNLSQSSRAASAPLNRDMIEVRATTQSGAPLPGALVSVVVLNGKIPKTMTATTNADGVARITGATVGQTLAMAMVTPHFGYWGMVTSSPDQPVEMACPKLPQDGPLGWWHHLLNADTLSDQDGTGVTVGVIDTGCGPAPQLLHVRDGGAIIGQTWSANGADVGVHGTFSCGVIGARPTNQGDYAGLAQGAAIVSVRVYPDDTSGANQMDVAIAIDKLSVTERADLINLSLYSMTASDIQQDAIRHALERGTVCVCSAGNNGGPVGYPAAFDETVAVSGLGQIGCAPEGSVDSIFVPTDPTQKFGENLYLATFSSRGDAVTAAGPAVGVLAPVPHVQDGAFGYAAMSGTSVAAPMICGALSTWLSRSEAYLALPRDETRSAMALKIFLEHTKALGSDATFYGAGLLPLKMA
ncbi:S8 family serine peptidase [Phaeobacter sp.]|uniref:S8 family serine peptidase n=1 Tax=Phaeobacter sp. TaxID=1902409 RepID=UPI0025FA81CB|nr:S8 family serine peptidase [Phaeobacter sp.]